MKNIKRTTLLIVVLYVALIFSGCSKKEKGLAMQDDSEKKGMMQGVWGNDIEGSVVFAVKGDTIYYNDSTSIPSYFRIAGDTIYIENHPTTKYLVNKISKNFLSFTNEEGDLVELTKTSSTFNLPKNQHKTKINQRVTIEDDSVMTYGGKTIHAYKKVNPTTFKVYQQSKNSDGLSVESVYYDNIIHIAIYDGQKKIFGQNIEKDTFAKIVPASYIEKAVLSDIDITGFDDKGVNFKATMSIPNSYTKYEIKITISQNGKMNLSL